MSYDAQKTIHPEIKREKFELLTAHFYEFLFNLLDSAEKFNSFDKRSPEKPIIEINIPICVGYNETVNPDNWALNKAICVKIFKELLERNLKTKIWLFENPKNPCAVERWKNRYPIIDDHLSQYVLDAKDYTNTTHWKNCYLKFNNLLKKENKLVCDALNKDLKNSRTNNFAKAMSDEEIKEHIIKDTVFCLSWMSSKIDNNREKLPKKIVLILHKNLFFSMKNLNQLSRLDVLDVFDFHKLALGGKHFDKDVYKILVQNLTSQHKELSKTTDRSSSLFNQFFSDAKFSAMKTSYNDKGQYIASYLDYRDKQAMKCVSRSFFLFFKTDNENQVNRTAAIRLLQETEFKFNSFNNQNS